MWNWIRILLDIVEDANYADVCIEPLFGPICHFSIPPFSVTHSSALLRLSVFKSDILNP